MSVPVVFLAFANDADAHLDLLKVESKEIMRALQDLDRKEHIKVHREESADLDEVFEALTTFKDRVAIFHYGGHADGTTLRLEGGAGHAGGLAGLLGGQDNLKLVFLNGCATRAQVDGLLGAGVKAVIATSVPIRDDKASEFGARFYQSLAAGRTIGQAFQQAESFLRAKYGDIVELGVVTRDLTPVDETPAPGDVVPWGLYVAGAHRDAVLSWKLPYYRPVGLPQDMLQYIGSSFTANRYIMLVLDEMAKYNPDIYAQMMEQRGGELVRKDSREYPELIIRNFPWPVGSQIRLLHHHDSPDQKRLLHLISTYVRAGHLLYLILLSDVWERRRRGEIQLQDGFELGQPLDAAAFRSFDFLARAIELIELFAAQGVATYMPEVERLLAEWREDGGRLRKAHEFLQTLQVQAASPPAADLEQLCLRAEQAVSVILRAVAFLARYRMLTVRSIMVKAPRFEPVEYELDMGPLNAADGSALNLYQDEAHRHKLSYANSHSIVLVRDEEQVEDCLNLSPFVIDKNTFVRVTRGETTNKDRLAHVFLLGYCEDDRLVYLSADHAVHIALGADADRIHTGMTQDDFTEGRNLLQAGSLDSFGLDAEFGLEPSRTDDSAKVFAVLEEQFASFRVDLQGTS